MSAALKRVLDEIAAVGVLILSDLLRLCCCQAISMQERCCRVLKSSLCPSLRMEQATPTSACGDTGVAGAKPFIIRYLIKRKA